MAADYIPGADGEFDAWQSNFVTYATANAAALGLDPVVDIPPLTAAQTTWTTDYAANTAAQAAAQAARQAKEGARSAFEGVIRPLVGVLQASAAVDDTERILGSQSLLLLILDVVPEDASQYDCVVTELLDLSCSTSDPATLVVTNPCPADMNDDGEVGPVDLAMLLGAWGPCPDEGACPADLNGDAVVNPIDLATLLGAWGECP
ncbi:MAG: hypothetical protein IIB58_03065 [Planctomycetes bacterium]|nr:hypothetical protein [Planctomycetota bacterium]